MNFEEINLGKEIYELFPMNKNETLSLPPILDSVGRIPMDQFISHLKAIKVPEISLLEKYGFWGIPGISIMIVFFCILVVIIKYRKHIWGKLTGYLQGSKKNDSSKGTELEMSIMGVE